MFSKPTRNHITIIFEQLGAAGVVIITFLFSLVSERLGSVGGIKAVIRSLKYGAVSDYGLACFAAAVLALVLLVLGWLLIRWYKTFFYIKDGYLVCERKTLNKKTSRLPLSSLATVNLERNVFEKAVGTAKIKIDINSAVTADKTDFVFVLSFDKARVLERILSESKESTAETSSPQERTNKKEVCSFSRMQAVRHVLLSQPIIQLLFSATVLVAGLYSGRTAEPSSVLPTLALVAAAWVFGIIAKILSLCRFRVECDEKSVYISSGILKEKKYSFERSKINAVVVRRSLLARMAGLYSAEVAVVGFGNDKQEVPQISLLVNRVELEKILGECAPDFICRGEIKKSAAKALVPCLLRSAAVSVLCAVPAWLYSPWLSAACIAAGLVFGVLSYKTKALSSDEKIFSYSSGVLSKKTVFLRYADIQTVQFRTSTVCNRLGISRISVSILSSNAMRVHTTGWFETALLENMAGRIFKITED